jgi:NAD-dependent dihydropyrimidine dehydrogenase PreA subunit
MAVSSLGHVSATAAGGTAEADGASERYVGTSSTASCRAEAGAFAPVIDRSKCEGKADCTEVCPYDVFEVRRMDDADFKALGLIAKLKSVAHGRKTAYTPRADACRACGKCVEACPEKAIKLARVS